LNRNEAKTGTNTDCQKCVEIVQAVFFAISMR
jgi:hypothetical protein